MSATNAPTPETFDPAAKEEQLAAESTSWDTSMVVEAVHAAVSNATSRTAEATRLGGCGQVCAEGAIDAHSTGGPVGSGRHRPEEAGSSGGEAAQVMDRDQTG